MCSIKKFPPFLDFLFKSVKVLSTNNPGHLDGWCNFNSAVHKRHSETVRSISGLLCIQEYCMEKKFTRVWTHLKGLRYNKGATISIL
jgi:hypothetical protein